VENHAGQVKTGGQNKKTDKLKFAGHFGDFSPPPAAAPAIPSFRDIQLKIQCQEFSKKIFRSFFAGFWLGQTVGQAD
jgi:hypothetical protein